MAHGNVSTLPPLGYFNYLISVGASKNQFGASDYLSKMRLYESWIAKEMIFGKWLKQTTWRSHIM